MSYILMPRLRCLLVTGWSRSGTRQGCGVGFVWHWGHRPFLASPARGDGPAALVLMADEQPEPVKTEFVRPKSDVFCSRELISL